MRESLGVFTSRLYRHALQPAVVGLAYWAVGRASLNFAALVHGQVTPIWPPTGIALVSFLVFGRRVWWGVFAASVAINLPLGPAPAAVGLIAVGNTLAPFAAANLLRLVGFRMDLIRLQDALALIVLAALAGMTVSASMGTSMLYAFGTISSENYWQTWAVWWTGDAMGVLLVAPFLLSVLPRPDVQPLTLRQIAELAALLAGIGVVTYVVFQNRLRLEYLVLPLITAAAFRFRLRGAAPAALVASGVAIHAAIAGSGPFATETIIEKMVTLQVFNVSVALASFVLASMVETRDREQRIAHLYETAQLASEAKTTFLNMAAHELRTPISVISGYLSILGEGVLGKAPDEWATPMKILETKTRELSKIVTDLLEASRAEAGEVVGPLSPTDLRGVVKEAAERARPRAELLEGQVIVSGVAAGPAVVAADRVKLDRILDNMINNALTYTTRKPRLKISLARENGLAIVRVADNGVGMRPDQREVVFERFHRLEEPALRSAPGTGLGLFISRHLAQGHGGRLIVESSTPGKGTVFALELPLAPQGDGALGGAGGVADAARHRIGAG